MAFAAVAESMVNVNLSEQKLHQEAAERQWGRMCPQASCEKLAWPPSEYITKQCAPTIFWDQVQGCLLHLEHVSRQIGLCLFLCYQILDWKEVRLIVCIKNEESASLATGLDVESRMTSVGDTICYLSIPQGCTINGARAQVQGR